MCYYVLRVHIWRVYLKPFHELLSKQSFYIHIYRCITITLLGKREFIHAILIYYTTPIHMHIQHTILSLILYILQTIYVYRAALVYGAKKWLLYPPRHQIMSNRQWVEYWDVYIWCILYWMCIPYTACIYCILHVYIWCVYYVYYMYVGTIYEYSYDVYSLIRHTGIVIYYTHLYIYPQTYIEYYVSSRSKSQNTRAETLKVRGFRPPHVSRQLAM